MAFLDDEKAGIAFLDDDEATDETTPPIPTHKRHATQDVLHTKTRQPATLTPASSMMGAI